eukprot:symbB.v1.2.012200.t1/scaffold835.1/size159100/27
MAFGKASLEVSLATAFYATRLRLRHGWHENAAGHAYDGFAHDGYANDGYANDGYADDEHAADDGHEPRWPSARSFGPCGCYSSRLSCG